MPKPIIIVVSTFNRPDLTGVTLDSLHRSKSSLSDVLIADDNSDYGLTWLQRWGWEVIRPPEKLGVGGMARFRLHQAFKKGYAFILVLDNDLVFAPQFDALSLQLYLSIERDDLTVFSPYHSKTQKLIGTLPPTHECWQAETINGCAQLMDQDTAWRVLDKMDGKWEHPWDANISRVLTKMVVPASSLVQHLGIHGTGVNGFSADTARDFVGAPM